MKRQFNMGQYGFTMVELMIVIAIIALFYSATATFNWTPQNDIEKVNRIKYAVGDKIRDEILKTNIGRMPLNNGKVATKTIITIGTGGMITEYSDSGSIIFLTGFFLPPYFDKDPLYSLTGVSWYTGATNIATPWSGTGKIVITQDDITFIGTNDPGNIILRITVGYRDRARRIELDRRTGKISIDS